MGDASKLTRNTDRNQMQSQLSFRQGNTNHGHKKSLMGFAT